MQIFKKDKFTLIPLGIVAIVLINFLVKTADKDLMQYTTFWYWLLYIGFVGSAVTAIMLFLDKNNEVSTNKPKVVNAQDRHSSFHNPHIVTRHPRCRV